MRRCGVIRGTVWGLLTGGLLAATVAVAQPPAAPPAQGGQIPEQMIQQMIAGAERLGLTELATKLKSQDPQVRQQAARELIEQFRQQRGQFGRAQLAQMQSPSVAIAATGKYVFVVRGDVLYQFDAETLKLLNQAPLGLLPPANAPPPAAPGPPAGGEGK